MPGVWIGGKLVEKPQGYNPLEDPENPMYQPPGAVQAANAGAAGPGAWLSKNLAAAPGSGYEFDPRFQDEAWRNTRGIGRSQLDAYDAYVRQLTGTEPRQDVVGGLAGQTFDAGGDLAAMAERTRQPGHGMSPYTKPMTPEEKQSQLGNPNLPTGTAERINAAPGATLTGGLPDLNFGYGKTEGPTTPPIGTPAPPFRPGSPGYPSKGVSGPTTGPRPDRVIEDTVGTRNSGGGAPVNRLAQARTGQANFQSAFTRARERRKSRKGY